VESQIEFAAMTKFHRLYETAILKTLGGNKRLIVSITLVEYGYSDCSQE